MTLLCPQTRHITRKGCPLHSSAVGWKKPLHGMCWVPWHRWHKCPQSRNHWQPPQFPAENAGGVWQHLRTASGLSLDVTELISLWVWAGCSKLLKDWGDWLELPCLICPSCHGQEASLEMDIALVDDVLPKQLNNFHIQCVCVDGMSQRNWVWCYFFLIFFLNWRNWLILKPSSWWAGDVF